MQSQSVSQQQQQQQQHLGRANCGPLHGGLSSFPNPSSSSSSEPESAPLSAPLAPTSATSSTTTPSATEAEAEAETETTVAAAVETTSVPGTISISEPGVMQPTPTACPRSPSAPPTTTTATNSSLDAVVSGAKAPPRRRATLQKPAQFASRQRIQSQNQNQSQNLNLNQNHHHQHQFSTSAGETVRTGTVPVYSQITSSSKSSRLSVINLRQFLHLDVLHLRPPFLRKSDPSASTSSLSSPSSPCLSSASTSSAASTAPSPSPSASPSPPLNLLSAGDLVKPASTAFTAASVAASAAASAAGQPPQSHGQKQSQSCSWSDLPDSSQLEPLAEISTPTRTSTSTGTSNSAISSTLHNMSHSYSQSPAALSNPPSLFLNSHQTQESLPPIGIACTTSPVTATVPANSFSSSTIYPTGFPLDVPKSLTSERPSLISPPPPPHPTEPAPPLPLSIIAEPVTRPPVPPEPFTPVAKFSTGSRRSTTMETPPRQVSPVRRQTDSIVSSVSPERRPPSHASTFPTIESPSLNVVPAENGAERRSREGSPPTHSVLTKRPPTHKEGSSSSDLLNPEAHRPVRQSRRLSFFGGMRSRANSNSNVPTPEPVDMTAWAMTKDAPQEYNLAYLLNGEQVPELWNETSNVSVYLFPRNEGRGPSFKVPGTVITSSEVFREYLVDPHSPNGARGRSFVGRNSLAVNDAFAGQMDIPDNQTPMALYVPEPTGDMTEESTTERLVAIRNMFAMLTGQSLVGTKAHPTPTAALFQVSNMLAEFGYHSLSGESFGEEVDVAFGFYMKSMDLSDMRTSRTRTIEALILAEKMRSRELYDDAFAHFAGKYQAIQELRSPLCQKLNPLTLESLARANLDLGKRLATVNDKLEAFNFPSVFTGVANSTSLEEFQTVDYKTWRTAFARMRTLVLGYYKDKFGNWPPKASSKKNQFTESGLNRLVLKTLYEDMCQVYDLIVDRKSITTRVMDKDMTESNAEGDPSLVALRRVLSEYDNSSLPVVPPIPYDTPNLPIFTSISEKYASRTEKQKHRFRKNIKDNELELVLEKSYDFEMSSRAQKGNILYEFKHMELKEAKGKPEAEIQAQRIGYWIFMYCVIQNLPWVVVDAADVKFSDGVEYFLCQPATGNAPWVSDHGMVRKQWYITPDGQTVELSADAVKFSTEAVYLRSHCWKMAAEWERQGFEELAPPAETQDITPPGSIHNSSAAPSPVLRPRSHLGSPRIHAAHRSSVAMGIEPISLNDLPPDVAARSNRMSMAFNPRQSMHARSRSVGPSPLQRVVSTPGSQYIDPDALPMPSMPLMQHSNASGPILRGSSPLGGMRESVYDQPGGGYMNNDINMSQYPSPLAQEQTATFDDILGVKKPKAPAAKMPKKKRSFFFSKPTKA